MVAEPPLAALLSECFKRCRYLHHPPRLLPAGATVAGRDSHPLRDGALPRRTMSVVYRSRDPRVSVRVSVTDRDRHGTATAMRIRVYRTDTRSLQQEADAGRRSKAPEVSRRARSAHACAHPQPAAWGVEPKAGPAGRIVDSRCMKDREIDAGEPGGSKPPRRLSGRRCGAHCARQCRAKCGRAPQERPHECREHCDRQCAEGGAVADALSRSAVHRPGTRTPNGNAGGEHSEPDGGRGASRDERGAKRARGCCGCRRTSVNIVRRLMKRKKNGPRHRSDAVRVRLRPRCAEPECRAAAPCRRGSR